MHTEIIDATRHEEAGTQLGARILKEGGVVAFPTETVYGLGADGLNPEAVEKVYEAKGRPADNPLILHVAKKNDVRRLWDRVPEKAQRLMDAFWPGPLTLVAEKSREVPDIVTAGLPTAAIRMPEHRTARALIRAAEAPVVAPSANASGRPSPTSAKHVFEDLAGKIPLIIDGGDCKYGLESTVVLVSGTPTILRPGVVTKSMLEAVVGPVALADSVLSPLKEGEAPASPGMKYRHYAPEAEVTVVTGERPEAVGRKIAALYREAEARGESCMILATRETERFYRGKEYAIIGGRDEPLALAAALFRALREAGARADVILAEGIPAEEVGLAFMNRLLRAAGFREISVP